MVYQGVFTLAWHVKYHRITSVTHSPDVAELHNAGLAHVAYQNLLVCTGHAGVTIGNAQIK